MNRSYVSSRILVLKYLFLFLIGILLHTFSISWMRNDRFNEDKNILLRFASQRFRSLRFTSEQFTHPFASLGFTGLLSVVYVFVVVVFQVCVLLVRVSPGNIFKRLRHFAPSVLLPFQSRSQGLSSLPSGANKTQLEVKHLD